jgi:hypothetical protein
VKLKIRRCRHCGGVFSSYAKAIQHRRVGCKPLTLLGNRQRFQIARERDRATAEWMRGVLGKAP